MSEQIVDVETWICTSCTIGAEVPCLLITKAPIAAVRCPMGTEHANWEHSSIIEGRARKMELNLTSQN